MSAPRNGLVASSSIGDHQCYSGTTRARCGVDNAEKEQDEAAETDAAAATKLRSDGLVLQLVVLACLYALVGCLAVLTPRSPRRATQPVGHTATTTTKRRVWL